MKIHPQFILQGEQPKFVVLPYEEYEKIMDSFEDQADREAVEAAMRDTSERFPLDFVERLAEGENHIKAFREYRGLSQANLAKQVGITRQYMSQLESGNRVGGVKLLKKIAACLKVDLDDLIEE